MAETGLLDGHAIGKVVEYCGSAVEALSVDERATLTNMAAEVGAFTGIVAADEKTVDFLVRWRGMDRERAEELCADRARVLLEDCLEHCRLTDPGQSSPVVTQPSRSRL